jgi:lipopolysaccharide export system permease protein
LLKSIRCYKQATFHLLKALHLLACSCCNSKTLKVIKKLDTLILRAFIGPFIATFLISIFVLVMQFFWLYIDDFVGKGLDVLTIFNIVGLVAATAVPLALPLALLISSIMTFGNLGESFELVAIKSAGIPLLRFMQPLFIVAVLISGVAFLFANNIIPVANLKLNALKYDIIVAKPAFDIKEGVFYDKIEGFVIKLGKKEKDDSTIRNVVIYEKNFNLQDNMMIAESGVMRVTPDKRFLEFILYNGQRYEERGQRNTPATDFIRSAFKEYKKVFDLSSFKITKTEDSLFQYDPKMLSVRQLTLAIDSIKVSEKNYYKRTKTDLAPFINFIRYADSGLAYKKVTVKEKSFNQFLGDSLAQVIDDRALAQLNTIKSSLEILSSDERMKEEVINKHWIEWHRKFALSAACIVLFMIGAPLGSIIRKGGLGTPLVFAIIFFVVFHVVNTIGEKIAKEQVASPFIGMWLSTLTLIPIGIFLTFKAMRDSQLFNQEFYFRFLKKLRKFIAAKRNNSKPLNS